MTDGSETVLLVGTLKGLFRFRSDDRIAWRREAIDFLGVGVHASAFDRTSGILYAAANNEFYGPGVQRSRDGGRTWEAGGTPAYAADDAEQVKRIWSLLPAPSHGEGTVYAGVEHSGLFRSEDHGTTWSEVSSLRGHPTHDTWHPGNGGKCLHTLSLDPFQPDRMYVAASTGGVYRTDDRGKSWRPANHGIGADFMPEPQQYPESGQCVHRLAVSQVQPDRLWVQNHGGVYRSDDAGDTWQPIHQGLPDNFGFPVVAHPHRADTAYVVPLLNAFERWFPGGDLRVYRTDDAGASWRALANGLPNEAFSSVLRGAFTGDGAPVPGLYFGTTSGSVFASPDEGETWHTVATNLPRILAVSAVAPTA